MHCQHQRPDCANCLRHCWIHLVWVNVQRMGLFVGEGPAVDVLRPLMAKTTGVHVALIKVEPAFRIIQGAERCPGRSWRARHRRLANANHFRKEYHQEQKS